MERNLISETETEETLVGLGEGELVFVVLDFDENHL